MTSYNYSSTVIGIHKAITMEIWTILKISANSCTTTPLPMVAKFGTLQQIPNTNSPNFALIDLLSRVSGNPHGTFFLHFQLRHPVVVPPSSMADRAEHGC